MRTDGDLCDFSASVSDGLRSVAGFLGSMEARSAACSTAEGGCTNKLLLFCVGVDYFGHDIFGVD